MLTRLQAAGLLSLALLWPAPGLAQTPGPIVAVGGGTSAGAAVLSAVMITGDSDLKSVAAGKTATADGLALWPEVIVDQHFLRRQRANRLIAAVLDRPALVGIGIDEGTAVVVRGHRPGAPRPSYRYDVRPPLMLIHLEGETP